MTNEYNSGDTVKLTLLAKVIKGTDNIFSSKEVFLDIGYGNSFWYSIDDIELVAKAVITPNQEEEYGKELLKIKNEIKIKEDNLFRKYYGGIEE